MATPPFTVTEFLVIFPEFSRLPDPNATVPAVATFVSSDVAEEKFGEDYKRASMLLTAHFLTVQAREGKGPVTNERVGELSRSYQALNAEDFLKSSAYGLEFIRLARRKVGSIGIAIPSFDATRANFPPVP